jgi:2-polyprenyl-3-methyl-5-hydroxy-6-metoxy-1,4-benzoquinol methylase
MMKCRHCQTDLSLRFIDLETAPPSNSYLSAEALQSLEKWYPLRVFTCEGCWLVQTEDYTHFGELFARDYAYFSSFSSSWLKHAERYVDDMVQRFGIGPKSQVVEVASNDGYLLQYVKQRGIPCTGVEPTASTAAVARQKGIEVVEGFFGVTLAKNLVGKGFAADLIVANNVLAHVPDINDFVAGFAELLKPNGMSTFEFPHLLRMVEECQFDTIYHEHFSYLSLTSVNTIFARNALQVFDVQELPTHGGSLRVFAQRSGMGKRPISPKVAKLLHKETEAGVTSQGFYRGFQERADAIKDELMMFLINAKRNGKRVGAYGAAAKGNTLLNYAGVRSNLLPWVVDRNPAKLGKYLPGCRIEIVDENRLEKERPDYIIILPWNLRNEIKEQIAYVREWGGRFVTAIPSLVVD